LKDLKKKIVLGTWSLSGDLGPVKTKHTYQLIDYSIKKGLKEFDIAPTYGFGKIDKIFSDFKKEKIKINTKIGYDKNRKKNFSISVLTKSVYTSYNYHGKLNTVFLHNPRNEIKDWNKIIDFMKGLKEKNITRYTGISLARDYYPDINILNEFDIIQDEVNILRRSSLLNKKNKFKLMARSPLATGILSNKFNINSKFSKQDYRYSWLRGKRKKIILSQIDGLKKIFGKDITNTSYSYLLHNNNIDKIIFGFKDILQLENILKITTLKKLSKKKINLLLALDKKNYLLKHKDIELLY
jgi:aryl-alcohol dehydrogenase-like predicted oxidoreductase